MTLYELKGEYELLLEMAEDPTIDPVTLEGTLEALGGEIEEKADGYARVMRQIEHDITALKAEESRLSDRRRAMENNVRRMKESLEDAMLATGKTKFKTELFSFNIQKNPRSVMIDDISRLPEEYLIPQDPKVDKAKLKEDLTAGVDLNGAAHLEQTEGLRIK